MPLPSCELAQNAPCRATGFSIDVIGINGRLFTLEGPASRTGHRTGFSCGLPISFSLHKVAR